MKDMTNYQALISLMIHNNKCTPDNLTYQEKMMLLNAYLEENKEKIKKKIYDQIYDDLLDETLHNIQQLEIYKAKLSNCNNFHEE